PHHLQVLVQVEASLAASSAFALSERAARRHDRRFSLRSSAHRVLATSYCAFARASRASAAAATVPRYFASRSALRTISSARASALQMSRERPSWSRHFDIAPWTSDSIAFFATE